MNENVQLSNFYNKGMMFTHLDYCLDVCTIKQLL